MASKQFLSAHPLLRRLDFRRIAALGLRGADRVRTTGVSILALSAILGSLSLVSMSATPNAASDEAEIEQLERDRQDAFVRGDIGALDRDTAGDYTTINGVGKLSTKPQMMENLRQGKTKV